RLVRTDREAAKAANLDAFAALQRFGHCIEDAIDDQLRTGLREVAPTCERVDELTLRHSEIPPGGLRFPRIIGAFGLGQAWSERGSPEDDSNERNGVPNGANFHWNLTHLQVDIRRLELDTRNVRPGGHRLESPVDSLDCEGS